MQDHLPSVGGLPQPIIDNACKVNKLRRNTCDGLPIPCSQNRDEAFKALRCESCRGSFLMSAGFTFLDNFYCDHCYRELAVEGGFWHGDR